MQDNLKNDYANISIIILLSVAFLFLVNIGILRWYTPDVNLIIQNSKHLFIPVFQGDLAPEPVEKLMYLVSIILAPFTILFSIFFTQRQSILRRKNHNSHCYAYINSAIATSITYLGYMFGVFNYNFNIDLSLLEIVFISTPICILALTVLRKYRILKPAALFFALIAINILIIAVAHKFVDGSDKFKIIDLLRGVINKNSTINLFDLLKSAIELAFVSIPLIILALYGRQNDHAKPPANLLTIVIVVILAMLFLINLFNQNVIIGALTHFNAVFYSISQVYSGGTIGVDTSSQYGLFPHFLSPIFQLIGLTVLNYSIVMSLLVVLCFLLLYLFFRNVIVNPYILIAGFLAVLFYHYLIPRAVTGDPYFQYHPLRFIFPILLLYVTTLDLKVKNKYYYILHIIFSLAIFWNIDSGAVVFATWILYLCYDELYKENWSQVIRGVLVHLFIGLLTLCLITTLFLTYTYLRAGEFPEWKILFKYQSIFYFSGFYMLPMPTFSYWNMVIFIYFIGLIFSMRSVVDRKNSRQAKIIFVLSILGIGLFSYYQGRSHDLVLLLVSYPSTIIIAVLLDQMTSRWRQRKLLLLEYGLLSVGVLFFTTALFGIYMLTEKVLLEESKRGMASILIEPEKTQYDADIEFIKEHSVRGEEIFIICHHQFDGLYYGGSHTRNASHAPGSSEIILIEDAQMQISFLNTNQIKKVFVNLDLTNIQVKQILSEKYKKIAVGQSGFYLFIPRNYR